MKVKTERFDEFFQAINQVAKEMLLPEDLIPTLDIDAELPLSRLETGLITQIEGLAPFGTDNPQPLFCSSGLKVRSPAQVINGTHLKFWVTDGELTGEAIGYNKAAVLPLFAGGETIDLAYVPSINTWRGNFSIQLKVEDVKVR